MKIHVLSDLHLEFCNFAPPPVQADVVVLAGDIHVKGRGVQWAREAFPDTDVIYVPGNHEYYGKRLGEHASELKALAQGSRVHVLDDQALVVNGVRFLGATLWTDYRITGNQPLAQYDAQMQMADFKVIRDRQYRRIRPLQLLERFMRSKQFLEEQLALPHAGPTVVVTHHAPSELSIAERFKTQANGHLSASFASRLDMLMGPAALWIHGHTHDSFDYEVYGTRVLCNPRGYLPDEPNPQFDPALVVEV